MPSPSAVGLRCPIWICRGCLMVRLRAFAGILTTNPVEDEQHHEHGHRSRQWPRTLTPGHVVQSTSAYATGSSAALARTAPPSRRGRRASGLGYHYGINLAGSDGRSAEWLLTSIRRMSPSTHKAARRGWDSTPNENACPGLYVNAIAPSGPQGWLKACPRLGRWQELDLPRQPDVDHRIPEQLAPTCSSARAIRRSRRSHSGRSTPRNRRSRSRRTATSTRTSPRRLK